MSDYDEQESSYKGVIGRIMPGDELSHIGIIRRSGRYPWGSGSNPFQRSKDFKAYIDEMTKPPNNMTHAQIAKALTEYANHGRPPKNHIKVSSTDVRAAIASSTDEIRSANINQAKQLKKKDLSNVKIAEIMGTRESTVRGWLAASEAIKENSLRSTVNKLKEELKAKEFLDVGQGTEIWMGINRSRLRSALAMLKDEGYEVHHMDVIQLGTDKPTKLRILTREGNDWKTTHAAVKAGNLQNVGVYTDDGGLTFKSTKLPPVSVSSKRMQVRYGDEGGAEMDGVIELRRGVEDLSLGSKRYAQVRVAVDGTHYLKGMAMYADDLPPGVDIRFNTPKTKAQAPGKLDALKVMNTTADGSIDNANPFGATVKQRTYVDKNGKEKISPLNRVNEEGNWNEWSDSLSSQMLSKQPIALAKQQLTITQNRKQADFDEIMSLTNPVVRQKLLLEFAESTDSASVHLKAAAMPRQSSHVILPINSLRPTEVYAPNFNTGDKVVLVRYPHGGPFEIPSLTVNNNNRQAKRLLGNAVDAVGIHSSVAEQLSGADFDGDTVLAIKNDGPNKIKSRPPLKQLEGFNPKDEYKIADDDTTTKRMSKASTQTEMGKISNLITDMTIHGASDAELARAVKHSMVVIDAEKHGLDYKQSEKNNGIAQLKKDYQGAANAGAATIISKAKAEKRVDKVVPRSAAEGGPIDKETGKLVYVPDPKRDYVGKDGVARTKKSTRTNMEMVDDARELMSKNRTPQPIEELYASHANTMKALANKARLEAINTKMPLQSKEAKAMYAVEVASLDRKLKLSQRNAPLERRAQVVGNAMAKARIDATPDLTKDQIKKIKYQSLEEARTRTEANRLRIGAKDDKGNSTLTTREWAAIQAGAVAATTLREILANADMDRVVELAKPRARTALTPGQLARARAMKASGKNPSEIAEAIGSNPSTVTDNLGF